MTGIRQHNFPAFEAAAATLRAKGYNVISPNETESVDHDAPKPWTYYLQKDIKLMMGCDHLVLLPGWEDSRGASLEYYIAQKLGFTVYFGVENVP